MRNYRAEDVITVVGIDLAKQVFHLYGVNKQGKAVLRKQIRRNKLMEFIALLPTCLIGMEACGGAHDWARKFKAAGHHVRLMNPKFVKGYVKSNKNDMIDAEAICEAVQRPNMRFVPIKSIEQQDIQRLHRAREQAVHNRTALSNQIRGLLMEYGVVIPRGITHLHAAIPQILEDADNGISDMFRELLATLAEDFNQMEQRIAAGGFKVEVQHIQNVFCSRMTQA